MFCHTESFNQNIGLWTRSSVTDMAGCFIMHQSSTQILANRFLHAYSFNQDIGSWNVSRVGNMSTCSDVPIRLTMISGHGM